MLKDKQRSIPRSAAVLIVSAIVLLSQVNSYWIPTPDSAGYLSIAKNIAIGNGFLRLGDTHLLYAPGYSLLISPSFFLAQRPFLFISLMHWILLLSLMYGVYLWAGKMVVGDSLLMTLLIVFNVSVLYYFRRTLSEALFMPLLVWTAIVLNKAAEENRKPQAFFYLALGSLICAYLCFTRQAGICVAAGFGVLLSVKILKREISRKKGMVYGIIVLLVAASATGTLVGYDQNTALSQGADRTYVSVMLDPSVSVKSRITDGLKVRIQEFGRIIIPGAFKAYGGWLNPIMILYIPLFIAIVIGWRRMALQHPDVLLYTFPFYFLLYIIWPYDQATRFMTPVVPVLWVSLWKILRDSKWKLLTPKILKLAFVFSVVTSSVYWQKDFVEAKKLDSYWPAIEKIAESIAPKFHQVAFVGLSKPSTCMLQVQFDRPLRRIHKAGIPEDVNFIVCQDAGYETPGFELANEAGPFRVLRRTQVFAR